MRTDECSDSESRSTLRCAGDSAVNRFSEKAGHPSSSESWLSSAKSTTLRLYLGDGQRAAPPPPYALRPYAQDVDKLRGVVGVPQDRVRAVVQFGHLGVAARHLHVLGQRVHAQVAPHKGAACPRRPSQRRGRMEDGRGRRAPRPSAVRFCGMASTSRSTMEDCSMLSARKPQYLPHTRAVSLAHGPPPRARPHAHPLPSPMNVLPSLSPCMNTASTAVHRSSSAGAPSPTCRAERARRRRSRARCPRPPGVRGGRGAHRPTLALLGHLLHRPLQRCNDWDRHPNFSLKIGGDDGGRGPCDEQDGGQPAQRGHPGLCEARRA